MLKAYSITFLLFKRLKDLDLSPFLCTIITMDIDESLALLAARRNKKYQELVQKGYREHMYLVTPITHKFIEFAAFANKTGD